MVRLIAFWDQIAPRGRTKPVGFDASNPQSPGYDWASLDRQVQLAVSQRLEPIIGIQSAPLWAERGNTGDPGTRSPDANELALFARAAARRYSGTSQSLPRVRYWQVWNEPNLVLFLNPTSPTFYRRLVNAFAPAVKAVHADNVVVAGGTSPFGVEGVAVAPLRFMRELLCMSAEATPRPTCSETTQFDVWSHHPYTTGGPRHRAANADDVSLGDLPEMRRVLDAATSAGHVRSTGAVRFWVTEFSWDTSPPDPKAVPVRLHARWVAEALHQMWRSGVSLVVWFQLRDEPLQTSLFQSGLYFVNERPKPALQAFRFPFVALRQRARVVIWGRTPGGRAGVVQIQRRTAGRWRTIRRVRTNRFGIFTSTLPIRTRPALRALQPRNGASVPFAPGPTRDISLWPFGCGGGILPC